MITAGGWTAEEAGQPVTSGALSLFTNEQELIRPQDDLAKA